LLDSEKIKGMTIFTEDQFESLAPDIASVKAAQKVYSKTSWEVSKSERAVWTSIKGSGKKPYFTRMDLEETAFKCSCPSRKFPCKHGLSLVLFLANNDFDTVKIEEEPEWVSEWIDKRRTKTEKKTAKPKKVFSPEDDAKKKDAKWKNATKNIEYLELWLQDFIKNGLIDLPSKSYNYLETLMQRMVDFKLPGINTFIRNLQNIDYTNQNWQEDVLKQIHLLNLIVKTVKQHKSLEINFKKELELLLGWNIKKDDLLQNKETEIIDDVWFIVNVIVNTEESLTSRKTYLYGTTSNRFLYILDFAFMGAGFTETFAKGKKIQAKIAVYPGLQKNRAILKIKGNKTDIVSDLKPIVNFQVAHNFFIEQKIAFPFTFEVPIFIENVNLVKQNEVFYLINKKDEVLKCINFENDSYFNLLAHSKGDWFDAFVVMSDFGIELLAIYLNEKMISL